jgi:MYXO-CTERM domain-containing protein
MRPGLILLFAGSVAVVAGCLSSAGSFEDAAKTEDPVTTVAACKKDAAAASELEKLGAYFDRKKFDAMDMGKWATKLRTAGNNTNKVENWNEDVNNCIGCDKTQCTLCHAVGNDKYMNAVGSLILPKDATFKTSKTEPFIEQYFKLGADGRPVASNGIKNKSNATKKGEANSHPLVLLTAKQQKAVDAFVADVLKKYNADPCNPRPPDGGVIDASVPSDAGAAKDAAVDAASDNDNDNDKDKDDEAEKRSTGEEDESSDDGEESSSPPEAAKEPETPPPTRSASAGCTASPATPASMGGVAFAVAALLAARRRRIAKA